MASEASGQDERFGSVKLDEVLRRLCILVVALVTSSVGNRGIKAQDRALPFSCEIFSANASAAALSSRFGPANVKTGRVPWGGAEGDVNEGTVLFDSTSDAKLEIYWRDRANKRNPEWVSVRGKQSRWRSPGGITLGTSLREIERLNARPFRLLGFGTDVSGTVISWSGGRLDSQNTARCRVRLRVGRDWDDREDPARGALIHQLIGEDEYSSGHPAMQALDPTVYEMFMQYAPASIH